ncbi:hypothetical protein Trydic_g5655 [Trypoxylus dichotomus]
MKRYLIITLITLCFVLDSRSDGLRPRKKKCEESNTCTSDNTVDIFDYVCYRKPDGVHELIELCKVSNYRCKNKGVKEVKIEDCLKESPDAEDLPMSVSAEDIRFF